MEININELRIDFVELQSHPEKYGILIVGITKKCSQCDEIKLLSEFNKKTVSKDNHRNNCRICQNKSGKEYRENNKEKIKEQGKKYRENNKEQINEKQKEWYKNNKEKESERCREYNKNNKEQRNEYIKNRKKTDPLYRLTHNVRSLTYSAFKNKNFSKKSKTAEILGCSFEELQVHLGKQMSRWMNWDNQGKYNGTPNFGWDIDHIIPLSSAKTEEELLKLCHYSNLQPLCSKVNRDIKRDRF